MASLAPSAGYGQVFHISSISAPERLSLTKMKPASWLEKEVRKERDLLTGMLRARRQSAL